MKPVRLRLEAEIDLFEAALWYETEQGGPLLNWARDNGHVVFTNDLDFSALLAMTWGHGPRHR